MSVSDEALRMLACPRTGEALLRGDHALVNRSGTVRYRISEAGIPIFAEEGLGNEALRQQAHYDRIALSYVENLGYPHTQEYTRFLDEALLEEFGPGGIGTALEVCCGRGEAFRLLGPRIAAGLGVDVSERMLEHAKRDLPQFVFVQGDATALPVASGSVDGVLMLGGIHHVNDRAGLFREVYRVLRPGGRFYFREPLNDFFLWQALRAVIYRISPALDHLTERPLTTQETIPPLERAGFRVRSWRSLGFLGFCFFMNSDVLIFNRLFRFLPGIRPLTRLAARFDAWVLRWGPLKGAGLQVIGVAEKPATNA